MKNFHNLTVAIAIVARVLSNGENAQAQDTQFDAKAIDHETIAYYQKLGGVYGEWVEKGRTHEFVQGPAGAQGGLPGFRFESLPKADLPPIFAHCGIELTTLRDGDIRRLAAFKNLSLLRLHAISDFGIGEISSNIDDLQTLYLDCSRTTSKGLQKLAALKRLRHLHVRGGVAIKDDIFEGLALMKCLVLLDLSGTSVTDLRGIGQLDSLEFLDLSSTPVTEKGCKELSALKRLRGLSLHSTSVTEGVLKQVASLRGLKLLDLGYTSVRNIEIECIKPIATLSVLKLEGTRITSTAWLASFTTLRILDLSHTAISDVSGLTHLTGLLELDLSRSEVNDDGMKVIRNLKSLELLNLGYTALTDVGLNEIGCLTRLEFLDIQWTNTSPEGLKALKPLNRLRTLALTGGARSNLSKGAKVTDETLRILREIGLLYALHLAEAKGGRRPTSNKDVAALDLSLTMTTDECLSLISVFLNLESLRVSVATDGNGALFKGNRFHDISNFKNLRLLDLSHSGVTDENMTKFPLLSSLEHLDLAHTRLSCKSIERVSQLPSLAYLDVSGTKLAKEGLRHLHEKLPRCDIIK